MQYLRFVVFLSLSLLAITGCGGGFSSDSGSGTTDPGTTRVTATVTGPATQKAGGLSKAAIPSQVASVTLDVKKPDCNGTSVYNTKVDTAGQTSVAFDFTLTAGTTACFTAGAYSSTGGSGTLLYQGSTSGISLVADQGVNVEISLSEIGAVKPTVTTDAATSVAGTTAVLNATINPNGFETTAYFEWGLGTTYGNTTPVQTVGSGSSNVAITYSLTGLSPATTYHYRAVANNSGNTVYGADQTFTTTNTSDAGVTVTFPTTSAPTAATDAATSATSSGATLNATVNPQGSATTVYFEWGTTTSYGNTTAWQEIGNGTADTPVSATLTGLTTGTTYHYRIVAYNAHELTRGEDGTVTAQNTTMTLSSSGKVFYNSGTFPDSFELVTDKNQPMTQSDTVGNSAPSVTWSASQNIASNDYIMGGSVSDLIMQVDVMFTNPSAAEGIYLGFRGDLNGSYYTAKYGPYYGGLLVLAWNKPGAAGEWGLQYGLPSSANTWYKLEVRAIGSSLQVYFNNTLKINVTDTSFTSGVTGLTLGVYNGSNTWYVDNFKIFKSYQITVSNLQAGQKAELYDSSNNLKASGTVATGQTSVSLDVSSLSFPFTGYFKVYSTSGTLLSTSQTSTDIWGGDAYSYQ